MSVDAREPARECFALGREFGVHVTRLSFHLGSEDVLLMCALRY